MEARGVASQVWVVGRYALQRKQQGNLGKCGVNIPNKKNIKARDGKDFRSRSTNARGITKRPVAKVRQALRHSAAVGLEVRWGSTEKERHYCLVLKFNINFSNNYCDDHVLIVCSKHR